MQKQINKTYIYIYTYNAKINKYTNKQISKKVQKNTQHSTYNEQNYNKHSKQTTGTQQQLTNLSKKQWEQTKTQKHINT